eukprot:jgi/Ulvmu1/1492/UM011_0222.1
MQQSVHRNCEYTAPDETALCNLASIALPRFVRETGLDASHHAKHLMGSLDHKGRMFDFEKLSDVVKTVTRNLNKVIDINYYPVETARRSNLRHRPIGLGVQGLADTIILLGSAFDSKEAKQLNKYAHIQRLFLILTGWAGGCGHVKLCLFSRDIFEAIYFSALTATKQLAKAKRPYQTYEGSPICRDPAMHREYGAHAWSGCTVLIRSGYGAAMHRWLTICTSNACRLRTSRQRL